MALERKSEILNWDSNPGELNPREQSFEFVLDTTFERLREQQIQYSIRRINAMDAKLDILEKELDEFLGTRP